MGGFELLKSIRDFNNSQKTSEESDLEQNLCPECLIPLKTNQKGDRSCAICGRVYPPL